LFRNNAALVAPQTIYINSVALQTTYINMHDSTYMRSLITCTDVAAYLIVHFFCVWYT